MLASLLPGLRDLRTPLAVGYFWFFNAWLFFGSSLQHATPRAEPMVDRFEELQRHLGIGASLAVLSFSAFLVGSLITFSINNVGLVPRLLPPIIRKWIRSIWALSRTEFELIKFLETRRPKSHGEPIQILPVGDLRTRLLIANQDLYGEYDRLDAEATFRINISLPVCALGLILRPVSIWWTISVTTAALVFLVRGAVQRENAQTVLMRAVLSGVIEHPQVAEWRLGRRTVKKKSGDEVPG
jgi:hypothetical protein